MKVLRVLLDTNVYDYFLKNDGFFITLKNSKHVLIYGNKIIRDELRGISSGIKFGRRSTRVLLLGYFDKLVGRHVLSINELTNSLALDYFKEYSGHVSITKLLPDFLIVANASLKNLDVVVSEDNRTMFSRNAIRAYNKVNERNDVRTPNFYSIKRLKELVEV